MEIFQIHCITNVLAQGLFTMELDLLESRVIPTKVFPFLY